MLLKNKQNLKRIKGGGECWHNTNWYNAETLSMWFDGRA